MVIYIVRAIFQIRVKYVYSNKIETYFHAKECELPKTCKIINAAGVLGTLYAISSLGE